MCMVSNLTFSRKLFFYSGRLFFLVVLSLGRGAHRSPAFTHASTLDPGGGPWRALWGFNFAKSGKQLRICFGRARACQDKASPTI